MVAGFKSENALYNVIIFVEWENVRGYIYGSALVNANKLIYMPSSSPFFQLFL